MAWRRLWKRFWYIGQSLEDSINQNKYPVDVVSGKMLLHDIGYLDHSLLSKFQLSVSENPLINSNVQIKVVFLNFFLMLIPESAAGAVM